MAGNKCTAHRHADPVAGVPRDGDMQFGRAKPGVPSKQLLI